MPFIEFQESTEKDHAPPHERFAASLPPGPIVMGGGGCCVEERHGIAFNLSLRSSTIARSHNRISRREYFLIACQYFRSAVSRSSNVSTNIHVEF
jgi:hypothetical protein